jgi:hypothetical protein
LIDAGCAAAGGAESARTAAKISACCMPRRRSGRPAVPAVWPPRRPSATVAPQRGERKWPRNWAHRPRRW